MAVNRVLFGDEIVMDLTADTVTPETLAAGVTAHNAAGERIVGTAQFGTGGDACTCKLIDRTTGIAYRLYVDNGILCIEPAANGILGTAKLGELILGGNA